MCLSRFPFQIVLSLVLITMFAFPVLGQQIQIVAGEYPPYNYYAEDGKITGVGTEVVRAVLKELSIEAGIRIYPWARAYNMALDEKNVLIYTIARSPQREKLFKWVGLIVETNACFFSAKSRKEIAVSSMDDAKKYRIGAVREDVRTQYLLSQGFENLEIVTESEQNFKKLLLNRIDLWLENELTGYYITKKNGYIPEDTLKKVYVFQVGSGEGYMAFSKNTSDELVEKFSKALEKVKRDGTYDRIQEKYR